MQVLTATKTQLTQNRLAIVFGREHRIHTMQDLEAGIKITETNLDFFCSVDLSILWEIEFLLLLTDEDEVGHFLEISY